ncbi:MAG: 3-oxoacyl-ACP reductase FabG [Gemmatimonadota bacterium]|nr:3-oxoacyl-ACP reductase FabG [Gemmatimonadota bacterium]
MNDSPRSRDRAGWAGDAPAAASERPSAVSSPPGHDPVQQLLEEVTTEPRPRPLLDTSDLRGRVAVVTGGSSGIGRAVCLTLAECGVHIGFCYFDDGAASRADAEQTAASIRATGVRLHFANCDVRDSGQVDAFVAQVREDLGDPDILVNNAGIGRDRALWRMSNAEWEAVLRTNLDGTFFFTRAVAPVMRAREHGKIVNVTSVHGIRSEFGLSNYSSSKAALIGFTRSTAVELGDHNINVNAVAPGYIRTTRLTDRVPAEILDHARDRSVLGRLGDPQDVAGVVLFLCSEAARHITGAVIPVDGGYLL